MRTLTCFTVVLAAVAAFTASGCLPASTSPGDGSPGDVGGGTVTYTKDVQPILMAKCATCHTTDGSGNQNIATTYADVLKPVQSIDAPAGCFMDADKTIPKKMGECALAAIMDGWMPMSMGCFNTPRPEPCVTLAQQAIIAAWVAAGMPQ